MEPKTYWAVWYCENIGPYGEKNLYRPVAICRTEEEAEQMRVQLNPKYGGLFVQEEPFGAELSTS